MRRSTRWLLFGASTGAAAALATAYGLIGRPWHLRWGATPDELSRAMPFDDMIPRPNYFSTRAITIDAAPDEIWPFLIDTTMLPKGTILRHASEKQFVVFAPPEAEAEMSWVVLLEPAAGGGTRVISRNRAKFGRRARAVVHYLIDDPSFFFVEREWLLGLKKRAEELARAVKVSTPPPSTKNEVEVTELVP
jgi:hypothetical protein